MSRFGIEPTRDEGTERKDVCMSAEKSDIRSEEFGQWLIAYVHQYYEKRPPSRVAEGEVVSEAWLSCAKGVKPRLAVRRAFGRLRERLAYDANHKPTFTALPVCITDETRKPLRGRPAHRGDKPESVWGWDTE